MKLYKVIEIILRLLLPLCRGKSVKCNLNKSREELLKIYKEKDLFDDKNIINKKTDNDVDLSIIVPTYNTEQYIEKCINSIIMQKTKYVYEIIVVDDESTDNTLKKLQELKSRFDFKVISQSNGGAGKARNTGINESVGKYITFVDSDDFIDENYVQHMLENIEKELADVCICGYTEIIEDNPEVIKNKIPSQRIVIKDEFKDIIPKTNGFIWGKVYKRTLFDSVRFPENYKHEDAIVKSVVLRSCKKICYINESLYNYLIRKDSLSHDKSKFNNTEYLDQYFMQEKIDELLKKINIPNDISGYKIMLHELGTCLWLRTRFLDKKTVRNIFNLASELCKNNSIEGFKPNFEEKYIQKALLNKDIFLWKMASLYSMLLVKRGNYYE